MTERDLYGKGATEAESPGGDQMEMRLLPAC